MIHNLKQLEYHMRVAVDVDRDVVSAALKEADNVIELLAKELVEREYQMAMDYGSEPNFKTVKEAIAFVEKQESDRVLAELEEKYPDPVEEQEPRSFGPCPQCGHSGIRISDGRCIVCGEDRRFCL